MRDISFLVAICMTTLVMSSCENQDTTTSKREKKHLIEDFTSQNCGYSPLEMDCINDYIFHNSNFVIIRHQVGSDNPLYIPENGEISNSLGVTQAPCFSIDRTNTGDNNAILHYPNELIKINKDKLETTTYASINISNKFDESSRDLQIHISGEIFDPKNKKLKLTVLIKESGVISNQTDFETYKGWQEFQHSNIIRTFMTNALGEEFTIDSQNRYSVNFNVTLNKKWMAQNCMVVAFLSEICSGKIIQVDEAPVVSNSSGGIDITHKGILQNIDDKSNHLLSIFTGFRCATSLHGIELAEYLKYLYGDKLILAVMHPASNPFTQGTYDYTCPAADQYYQYFGGTKSTPFPTGNIDMKLLNNSYFLDSSEWYSCLSSLMTESANVQIRAMAELLEDKKSIYVTSTARSEVEKNYQLLLWLLEDSVKGVQMMSDGSVSMNFFHNYLLRTTGNNIWGLECKVSSNESKLVDTIFVPSQCDIHNCNVVILLRNKETGQIENAIQIPILGTSIR